MDSDGPLEHAGIAAEEGDPVAQNRFGAGLALGQGVLRSDVEARKWLNRAATQGHAEAQFNLGKLCHSISIKNRAAEEGAGRIEAYMWYHLAASQGHAQAKAACEMLNLQLSDIELAEGNRRANAFQTRKGLPQEPYE